MTAQLPFTRQTRLIFPYSWDNSKYFSHSGPQRARIFGGDFLFCSQNWKLAVICITFYPGSFATWSAVRTYSSHTVDDGCLVCVFLVVHAGLFGDQRPQLVQVEGRTVVLLLGQMEVTHTDLAEVSGMAEMWRQHWVLCTKAGVCSKSASARTRN